MKYPISSSFLISLLLALLSATTTCFQPLSPVRHCRLPPTTSSSSSSSSLTPLYMSGFGITDDYTWKEEALEIELTVQVPPGTKGKDVHFKPGLTTIDLKVDTTTGREGGAKKLTLLDGSRKLRGRISLDGTYWVFSDRRRSITITIEKYFVHSNDDMQVLDYDWKGIYPDDEEEVTDRKYDEPEVLNVRDYAASLGVDVDNINRTLVDESMFSSGLNLTERALDQLTDSGYLTEVTKQADGNEYRIDPETGESEPFTFEDDKQSKKPKTDSKRVNIPFIDTNSPWHQAVPVSVDTKTNQTTISDEDQLRETLKQTLKATSAASKGKDEDEDEDGEKKLPDPLRISDPIEQLTVKRLKEILRNQGLRVSGSKSELQERLRDQVNSLVQTKPKGDGDEPVP